MTTIHPENWKIELPLYPPSAVLDMSTLSEYARCPRRGLYKYGLRRGFVGKSYPIQYGLAYHKYRETVEQLMLSLNCCMTLEIHNEAGRIAMEGWEDPPFDHKRHAHLDSVRLRSAFEKARQMITREQTIGDIKVIRPEAPFDLELPFVVCQNCGWAKIDNTLPSCDNCGSLEFFSPRHGGRVDQFIRLKAGNDMVRDFKTTGTKGEYYDQKFDPNGQLQGYVWAGSQLAGREFKGAMVETVYNTKTKGPEISHTFVEFTSGQQEQWLASVMMERQWIETMWSRVEELGYLAFPQRTNACQDYGGCRYRDACRTSSGWEINTWLENNCIYSEWDFMDPDKEESGV